MGAGANPQPPVLKDSPGFTWNAPIFQNKNNITNPTESWNMYDIHIFQKRLPIQLNFLVV